MPSIDLNVSGFLPIEKAALFLSWLAYPLDDFDAERRRFWEALCYRVTKLRGTTKSKYDPMIIRAYILDANEKHLGKILDKGLVQIQYRVNTAELVGIPHFRAVAARRSTKITISHLLDKARWSLADYGWKVDSDSFSTAKTKLWKPTRPVIHAAVAFLMISKQLVSKESNGKIELWTAVLRCMIDKEFFAAVIFCSELLRMLTPAVKTLHIRDDELIQFYFDPMVA